MEELYAILMILAVIAVLLTGFPVALSLGGGSLLFAFLGYLTGDFDIVYLQAFPNRMYGIMGNESLIALPLFIFMGVLLERSGIAEELLSSIAMLFGAVRGGMGVAVCLVGALLAASTGVVGATVVTMGLISLPSMLREGYRPSFATGIVTAAGTLGQIIPPSIILIILGDQMSSAYQQALLAKGDYSGANVSVGDLFAGALLPGLLLVFLYMLYIFAHSYLDKDIAPVLSQESRESIDRRTLIKNSFKALGAPCFLILGVLGSILIGLCTPTEAASAGCMGSLLLSFLRRRLNPLVLKSSLYHSMKINAMVFLILIGSSMFSLVFRAYHGDEMVTSLLHQVPGGKWGSFCLVMLLIFALGFFLDFFEICFVVVPVVAPSLLSMGLDPIWLGVMIAMNLQSSFLTPPFGFALFYLRGVAPQNIETMAMYKGVSAFIVIQILVLILLVLWPSIVTWLPQVLYPAK